MEMWNHMRVQFTGEEENKADLGTRDQKIPIQKTRSFKEKKKGQNWFQKQFSRKTTGDYDSRGMEHAAAFAINLQEVTEQKNETPEASLTKTKSKVDGTKSPFSQLSKRFSGSFRSKDDQGNKVQISSVTEEEKPEMIITPAPKASTFTDKKPKTPALKTPPPPPPPPPLRQTSTKSGPLRKTPTGPSVRETKAEEWEKTELHKIRQRYEKLKEMIESWENKKKMKARNKLVKQESELERRRLKAVENFQNKMRCINQVAEGTRAKAEESRSNEEVKAKEKANAIRTTGKLPGIFSCF